jgi:putative intracellular protease/amidase
MRALFVVTNTARLGETGEPTGFHLSAADRSDPINAAFLEDPKRMSQVERTLGPGDASAQDYDAIMFAGGHGTMWDFPQATWLADVAAQIYEGGGVVGAVCHGPAGLLPVRLSDGRPLVEGKCVAAFTNDEERAVHREEIIPFFLADALVELGAEHVSAPNFTANVIVDERLVTGQNPASASQLGRELVRLLAREAVL